MLEGKAEAEKQKQDACITALCTDIIRAQSLFAYCTRQREPKRERREALRKLLIPAQRGIKIMLHKYMQHSNLVTVI